MEITQADCWNTDTAPPSAKWQMESSTAQISPRKRTGQYARSRTSASGLPVFIGYLVIIFLLCQARIALGANENEWSFQITPAIWAAGFESSIAGGGSPIISSIDSHDEFFIPENLDIASFLSFEAKKGPWRLIADSVYVNYSEEYGSGQPSAEVEMEGVIVEGAVGYKIPRVESIELIAGGRFFSMREDIELSLDSDDNSKKVWADPFIGARFKYEFSSDWSAGLRADVGGFGTSSNEMYNVAAFVGYRLNEITTLKLGYRHLSGDFQKDLFKHDAPLEGVGLNLGIRF